MTLATIILLIVFVALAIYTIFGGADFGVGVWEAIGVFDRNQRDKEHRTELSYQAIGPVWETNHVWLIFILVILFGAFPLAFASINESLFVPMLLALVGIVFRGAAYAFRSQLKSIASQKRLWESVFAIASLLTPLFLGACVGAIASGDLKFDAGRKFVGNHLTGWINPLSIFVGLFTVGMCAYSSSVLLFREATIRAHGQRDSLVEFWRKRSIATGVIVGAFAAGGLILVIFCYPALWEGMRARGWPAILLSGFCGVASIFLIAKQRIHWSAIFAATTCATVVFGWGLSQFPYLIPGVWSIDNAKSPDSVLMLILVTTIIGSVLLLPALYLLFVIFKSENEGRSD